jgi:hypothetical protein
MSDGPRRRHRPAIALLVTCAVVGCGSNGVTLNDVTLGLPQSSTPPALATATVFTSPDGGIYKNADHLEVILVQRHNVDAVAALLGDAPAWSQLRGFGDFTLVAMRLRDDGKVSSDPRLGDLQMASDYAPTGTATGPLRHFYHPTYPLALVADSAPGDDCSIHLDPGHSGLAILIYPPVNLPSTLVWGRLGDFILSVPTGGALPPPSGALRAVACVPPAGAIGTAPAAAPT